MRVLMLVGSYLPASTGGIETFVHHLSSGLRERGHEVVLAAPAGERAPRDEVAAGGVQVRRFYFPDELTRGEYLLRERPRGFGEFAAWYEDVRPDVVHAHYLSRPAVIPFLEYARASGARTLLTAHYGAMTCMRASRLRYGTPMLRFGATQCDGEMRPVRCAACTLQSRGVPRPAAWMLGAAELVASAIAPSLESRVGAAAALPAIVRRNRSLLHRLYDALDWFVVVAEWQHRALLANGLSPERIARVAHGTRLPDARRSRPGRAGTAFGWAGRATPEKGLAELVDVFLSLPDRGATLDVACIAGPPEEVEYRNAVARRAAGDPRLRWVPPFGPDTAAEFYDRIDVLVAPYAVETGPLTVIEAFAHGVPVIGSDLGGIRELVDDGANGRLVDFRDARALRAALVEALRPEVVRRWSSSATWTRAHAAVTSDYLALYASTSAHPAGPPRPQAVTVS